MKNIAGAAEKITEAVMSWEGVSSRPHRFGGIEDVLVALDILNATAYTLED